MLGNQFCKIYTTLLKLIIAHYFQQNIFWWRENTLNLIVLFCISTIYQLKVCSFSHTFIKRNVVLFLGHAIHVTNFCTSWSTRPTTVPAGSDHYFHTCCPSVRPSGTKLQNPATITAGRDCGLAKCKMAKWIIDDSCLVILYVHRSTFRCLIKTGRNWRRRGLGNCFWRIPTTFHATVIFLCIRGVDFNKRTVTTHSYS